MDKFDRGFTDPVVATLANILRRITVGELTPRSGLGELISANHAAPDSDRRYVGEEYGIAQLIGYFYAYDDLEERPSEVSFDGIFGAEAFSALDTEVIRLANDWLRARGA
jgi:hypothetical protein